MTGFRIDDEAARNELQDALARVMAQARVVRLAMSAMKGLADERDMRAIMSSLDAIADDLTEAEAMLKR